MSERYRKKPVEVEAMFYSGVDGGTARGLADWVGKDCYIDTEGHFYIDTLEGPLRASLGDYIVRGVKGEFYPVKPEIFAATYEKVEPE